MGKVKAACLFFFLSLFLFQPAVYAEFHHVEGCTVCHDYTKFNDPTANLRGINDVIRTPNSGYKEVVFRDNDYTDDNFTDFADGDSTYNGVCEVCHTVNNHHRNDGSDNTEHMDGKKCTQCHLHVNEFAPPFPQAHRTHLDYRGKGPLIQECTVCHQDPYVDPSIFRDGLPLETTTACDNCHSPWGSYPGGDENTSLMDPVLGAKANFATGIYEDDEYTLKEGKEKWCITCHDDRPSTSKYDSPPDAPPPTVFLSYLDSTDLNWHNEVAWAGTVKHYNNNTWNPGTWIQYDPFTLTTTGTYGVYTRYFDGNSPTSDCNVAGKELLVEVSSTGGSYQSMRWLQPSDILAYEKIGDFNITAGDVTIKVSKDLAGCWARMGDVKVESTGGSGGAVVFAPMIAGDDLTWGFYATGHGVAGVQCTECHDPRKKHIDYNYRTHEMNNSVYGQVVNPWGDSYRLQTKDPKSGEAICARCHDFRMVWDGGTSEHSASRVRQTGFRHYNNEWSETNYHAFHMKQDYSNSSGLGADSDWSGLTDSSLRCANCHNVHGSTRGRMFRDGHLISDPYTTSKMPLKDVDWQIFAKAKWKPTLQGGDYNVSVWYPAIGGAATNSSFYVKDSKNYATNVIVDQTANTDSWVSLGSYTFDAGTKGFVFVNNNGANGNIVADAVRFTSAGEDIIMDNGDTNYTTYGTFTASATGNGGDSEYIANTARGTDENAMVFETTQLRVPGVLAADIVDNNLCYSCHGGLNTPQARPAYTGPKILNRFESRRWVLNDGSEDAEVVVTVQDTDTNVTNVTLDLTSIGGTVVNMNWTDKQNFSYTIPGAMINGLSDISYKLPVTATDPTASVITTVTHETYLFPKDGNDTIYMDTNDVELYDVNDFRFAINSDGFAADLPANRTYFGAGYRYSVFDLATGYGKWTPTIPVTGKYAVYAFWNETGHSVKYTAYAADGTYEVVKDQQVNPGAWNYIGTYAFLDDESNYIKQTSEDNLSMVADAMKFVRVNSEPLVRLSAKQNNQKTRILRNSSDRVLVTATASDYDPGDTPDLFTYDWSGSDPEILAYAIQTGHYAGGEKLDFSPIDLTPGLYNVEVNVTDSNGGSTVVRMDLQVPQSYPVLGAVDTDGDGINDNVEGLWDFDEDGIPNYLDNNVSRNAIPDAGTLSIMTENGLSIRVGSTALKAGSVDGVVNYTEFLAHGDGAGGLTDGGSSIAGGIFDFDIVGLKTIGQSVKVAFPLQWGVTVSAGSHYNKYSFAKGWYQFVEDADNKVESALKVGGVCPEPGSSSYRTLTAGDECIQLTIKDGGPNDADGLANGEVKDPGGLVAGPPEASAAAPAGDSPVDTPSVSYSSGGGGAMGFWTLLMLSLFGLRLLSRRS